jgi:SPP1 gp7 family putative phage head morphogenesis protein
MITMISLRLQSQGGHFGGETYPIDRDRDSAKATESAIERAAIEYLDEYRRSVSVAVGDKPSRAKLVKAKKARESFKKRFQALLISQAQDAAKEGLYRALGISKAISDADFEKMFTLANEHSIEWATQYAGELIKEVEGYTHDEIERIIKDAVAKSESLGWSTDDLRRSIMDSLDESGIFDEERANMIARTETAYADTMGSIFGWQESGVVSHMEWSTSASDSCDDCRELDGFTSPIDGDMTEWTMDGSVIDADAPPLHPNCRCSLLPVAIDE